MNKSYKIEVFLTPNHFDNRYKPYFGILYSQIDEKWCNEFSGWAISPESAWKEAYNTYTSYKI